MSETRLSETPLSETPLSETPLLETPLVQTQDRRDSERGRRKTRILLTPSLTPALLETPDSGGRSSRNSRSYSRQSQRYIRKDIAENDSDSEYSHMSHRRTRSDSIRKRSRARSRMSTIFVRHTSTSHRETIIAGSDARSISRSRYFRRPQPEHAVVPSLAEILPRCLNDINLSRPADPVEGVAQWLYQSIDNNVNHIENWKFNRDYVRTHNAMTKAKEKKTRDLARMRDKAERLKAIVTSATSKNKKGKGKNQMSMSDLVSKFQERRRHVWNTEVKKMIVRGEVREPKIRILDPITKIPMEQEAGAEMKQEAVVKMKQEAVVKIKQEEAVEKKNKKEDNIVEFEDFEVFTDQDGRPQRILVTMHSNPSFDGTRRLTTNMKKSNDSIEHHTNKEEGSGSGNIIDQKGNEDTINRTQLHSDRHHRKKDIPTVQDIGIPLARISEKNSAENMESNINEGERQVYTNTDGYFYDGNGQIVDATGKPLYRSVEGHLVDENGQIVDETETPLYINKEEHLVDENGQIVDVTGKPLKTNKEGHLVDENGQILDAKGKPLRINKEGLVVDKDGLIVDVTEMPPKTAEDNLGFNIYNKNKKHSVFGEKLFYKNSEDRLVNEMKPYFKNSVERLVDKEGEPLFKNEDGVIVYEDGTPLYVNEAGDVVFEDGKLLYSKVAFNYDDGYQHSVDAATGRKYDKSGKRIFKNSQGILKLFKLQSDDKSSEGLYTFRTESKDKFLQEEGSHMGVTFLGEEEDDDEFDEVDDEIDYTIGQSDEELSPREIDLSSQTRSYVRIRKLSSVMDLTKSEQEVPVSAISSKPKVLRPATVIQACNKLKIFKQRQFLERESRALGMSPFEIPGMAPIETPDNTRTTSRFSSDTNIDELSSTYKMDPSLGPHRPPTAIRPKNIFLEFACVNMYVHDDVYTVCKPEIDVEFDYHFAGIEPMSLQDYGMKDLMKLPLCREARKSLKQP